jgi:hypothetical protein
MGVRTRRPARIACDGCVSAPAMLLRERGFAQGRVVKSFALIAALG